MVALPGCLKQISNMAYPDSRGPRSHSLPGSLHRPAGHSMGRRHHRRDSLHRALGSPAAVLLDELHALPQPRHGRHVHGLPQLGRPDVCRQAPERGPITPASHVLPEPAHVLAACRNGPEEGTLQGYDCVPAKIWEEGSSVIGNIPPVLRAVRGKVCVTCSKFLHFPESRGRPGGRGHIWQLPLPSEESVGPVPAELLLQQEFDARSGE